MLSGIKKSLRAKFTLVLLIVGIIPLALASLFFYYTAKDALFKNVFRELKWTVNEISGVVESHFLETGKDLLIASQNTAFNMYFKDTGNKAHWIKEQHKTLKYLRGIYRDVIDEACYIGAEGKEISRIVLDNISKEDELSSDEDRSRFFQNALRMGEGEIYQGKPAISEDTKRWVLPNATPIFVNGNKVAILHFEVTMTYFQRLLKRAINPDRGYGFIINDAGEFVANTSLDMNETAPFPRAIASDTQEPLKNIYKRMMNGDTGIEQFDNGGKEYYIVFKPIRTGLNRGENENKWSIAYVLPSEKVYVELSILKYNVVAIFFTSALVMLLAYIAGNYVTMPIRQLADATKKVADGEMPRIDLKREDELGTLSVSFNKMAEAVKKRDEALKALAITDGLTGLYNHRYFKDVLDKEFKSAIRFGRPLSLIMADIDFFKNYNDNHGHANGDIALKQVARVFREHTREVDLAARYGGEEFVVILPETALEGAITIAERLRKRVEEEIIPYEEMQPNGDVTVSIGVASFPEDALGMDSLIEAADSALYKAKDLGRNRVFPESGRVKNDA